MTPQQALQVIVEATAELNAKRSVHETIIQAINTLKELVEAKEPVVEVEKAE